VITVLLLKIVWESGQTIFIRLLDGIEPEVIDAIHHGVEHVAEVDAIKAIRARWLGHRLHTEIEVAVRGDCTIRECQVMTEAIQAELQKHLPYLDRVVVQVTERSNDY
jgi:divalent metal cation (Fe/Co/Zn/Cd) transporter